MATTRTPAKKAIESRNPPISPELIIIDERAGPSQTTPPEPSRVRRSIGEWESAMVEPRPCSSTAHAHSPTKTAPAPAAQLRPKTKAMTNVESKTAARRASTEASVVSPGPRPETAKPTDRVTQARRLLAKAKSHVSESRNLRSDLKTGITQALDGLFALVKEMAAAATAPEKEININKKAERSILEQGSLGLEGNELLRMMKEQGEKIDKTQREMEKLKETIVLQHEAARQQLTYAAAAAAAAPPVKPTVERKSALHSIMIESKDELETGDEVMRQVREAVNAKDGWVTVERVKKVKDKKVILGCRTIEEREKVKERLQSAANRLSFEDMKNQDPMVILRDVIASHSENDILMALRNQNGGVFQGLEAKDSRMEVRFRRKARNHLMNHVVLRVSPHIYNRMMERGSVHIDIQRVRVADQSPLVQCSMCLAYGHGRRFCKETTPRCTHCGGPHMRHECEEFLVSTAPKCCNCVAAKFDSAEHNAFSSECPVRRKWEALARAKVQYRC